MPITPFKHLVKQRITIATANPGNPADVQDDTENYSLPEFKTLSNMASTLIKKINEEKMTPDQFLKELNQLFLYEKTKKESNHIDWVDQPNCSSGITKTFYIYDARPVVEALYLDNRAELLKVMDALIDKPRLHQTFIDALEASNVPPTQLYGMNRTNITTQMAALYTHSNELTKKDLNKATALLKTYNGVQEELDKAAEIKDIEPTTLSDKLNTLRSKLKIEQAFLAEKNTLATHRGYKNIVANIAAGLFIGYLIGVLYTRYRSGMWTSTPWSLVNTKSQNILEAAQKQGLSWKP